MSSLSESISKLSISDKGFNGSIKSCSKTASLYEWKLNWKYDQFLYIQSIELNIY